MNIDNTDPTTWEMKYWYLSICMGVFGGLINWLAKVNKGVSRPFNVVELLGELFASGVVGLIVFMSCQANGISVALSAALSGVGGHMGTRLLFILEKLLEKQIESKVK
jgi:hypothetical protein